MNLSEIGEAVERLGFRCWCGEPITAEHVRSYDHRGGITVDGFAEKQWVHFRCPGCGYGWALWKILNRKGLLVARGSELKALEEASP